MDESGNTGSDLVNLSQPIFTFIGIGINHENMVPILNEVEEIKRKHNIDVNRQLHAKRIKEKTRNVISKEIIDSLIKNNFSLFFSIVEKKFVIATYIDSEFFDPVYNKKCDNTWTYPSDEMNRRANFFYNHLSDETFDVCAKAFQDGCKIKEAYELVKADIRGKSYDIDLYNILQGVESHLDELAEIIKSQNSSANVLGASAGVLQSPNFFSFCGLINKIEQYYTTIGNNEIELIFDSSRQFNRAFINIVEKYKNAEKIILQFKEKFPLVFGYERINKFRYEKSRNNIFLQLSDLIATSLRNVVQKIYFDDGMSQYNDFEAFILYLSTSHYREFGNIFCDFVISDSLISKLIKTMHDENRVSVLKRYSNSDTG